MDAVPASNPPGSVNAPAAPRERNERLVLDLPRLVLRRVAVIASLALAAAVWLGWTSAAQDIEDEVHAARSLARVLQTLNSAPSPAQARAALAEAGTELRHLQLQVVDAQGLAVWASPEQAAPGRVMQLLLEWHRRWQALPEAHTLRWQVNPTAEQGPWTVGVTVSPESERREALADGSRLLAVLGLGLLALWVALRLSTRRAFEPLAQLVQSIEAMATQGARALKQLPAMPIRELASITQALQHLAADLDHAQSQRRFLSHKVQSVQEEERNHLARELHDEMGQRLTALRVDIAWLSRQLSQEPRLHAVVQAMNARCQEVQTDLRGVLTSLRPLGPTEAGEPIPLARLLHLLKDLVASWCSGAAAQDEQVLQPVLHLTQCDSDERSGCDEMTQPQRPLSLAQAATLVMSPALALAVYRLSQEGLTNVARHARARRAELRLTLHLHAGEPYSLGWSLTDDGVGLPSQADVLHRGNGLGGMQERVWALGGEWRCEPAGSSPNPGLRLTARLPWSGVAS